MNNFWRRNLIPSLVNATILGAGAMVVWFLLLMAAWGIIDTGPRSGLLSHRLGLQAAITVALLSPAMLMASPLYLLDHPVETFGQYLGFLAVNFWFSYFVIVILSIALALVVYLHHRRFGFAPATIWALYVMVFGVPGAIGYWLHRRWPPKERCSRCGANVPRDRDACFECGKAFPLPSLKGVEMLDKTSAPSHEREVASC